MAVIIDIITWQLFPQFGHFLRSFLKDEAGEKGGGVLRRQIVENAVEKEFRDDQLVARTDLACDPTLG